MITLELPLYVELKRKNSVKRVYAGMNVYRNLHHHVSNDVKKSYKAIVWGKLEHGSFKAPKAPVSVAITLYAPDARDRDLANVLPVLQKYCDDAVVEYGLIKDDSVKYIKEITYKYGGIDRTNPRAEIVYKGADE